MMERFLIRTNQSKDGDLAITNGIKDYLENRGKKVSIELLDDAKIMANETTEKFKEGDEPDLVIVLGGDGTMLRAARDFMFVSVPLLGVNLGSMGYLTEVEIDNVYNALDDILNGDYETEERMMLEGTFIKAGHEAGHVRALNDIAVLKEDQFRAIGFNIYVNGKFLKDYSADGVIVASPTGSTGYNLSAGGPIVEPGADLLVLTPVSPHTLMARSILLSAKDEIKIELKAAVNGAKYKAVAAADAATRMNLESGDCFVVKRSEKRTKFVKVKSESFLEVLSRKLS